MTDIENQLTVICKSPDQIVGAVNELMPQLSKESRRELNLRKLAVLQNAGTDGLYRIFNGRTVREILCDKGIVIGDPIDSGVLDDVRYSLYDGEPEAA